MDLKTRNKILATVIAFLAGMLYFGVIVKIIFSKPGTL